MYLVQMLLPLYDNHGQPLPREQFQQVRAELTERFGGATAYSRSPAEGTWRDGDGRVQHDDVVVVEVMVERFDRRWWSDYRDRVCRRFRQAELVVRATPIETL
jgi:hypothetical protein